MTDATTLDTTEIKELVRNRYGSIAAASPADWVSADL